MTLYFGQILFLCTDLIKFDIFEENFLGPFLVKGIMISCPVVFWSKYVFFIYIWAFLGMIFIIFVMIKIHILNKFDDRIWLNSNFDLKSDLKFKFPIRNFSSNSELFWVKFKFLPCLLSTSSGIGKMIFVVLKAI